MKAHTKYLKYTRTLMCMMSIVVSSVFTSSIFVTKIEASEESKNDLDKHQQIIQQFFGLINRHGEINKETANQMFRKLTALLNMPEFDLKTTDIEHFTERTEKDSVVEFFTKYNLFLTNLIKCKVSFPEITPQNHKIIEIYQAFFKIYKQYGLNNDKANIKYMTAEELRAYFAKNDPLKANAENTRLPMCEIGESSGMRGTDMQAIAENAFPGEPEKQKEWIKQSDILTAEIKKSSEIPNKIKAFVDNLTNSKPTNDKVLIKQYQGLFQAISEIQTPGLRKKYELELYKGIFQNQTAMSQPHENLYNQMSQLIDSEGVKEYEREQEKKTTQETMDNTQESFNQLFASYGTKFPSDQPVTQEHIKNAVYAELTLISLLQFLSSDNIATNMKHIIKLSDLKGEYIINESIKTELAKLREAVGQDPEEFKKKVENQQKLPLIQEQINNAIKNIIKVFTTKSIAEFKAKEYLDFRFGDNPFGFFAVQDMFFFAESQNSLAINNIKTAFSTLKNLANPETIQAVTHNLASKYIQTLTNPDNPQYALCKYLYKKITEKTNSSLQSASKTSSTTHISDLLKLFDKTARDKIIFEQRNDPSLDVDSGASTPRSSHNRAQNNLDSNIENEGGGSVKERMSNFGQIFTPKTPPSTDKTEQEQNLVPTPPQKITIKKLHSNESEKRVPAYKRPTQDQKKKAKTNEEWKEPLVEPINP